jgi:hypothetical protein
MIMAARDIALQILTLLSTVNSIDFNYPAVFNFGDSNSDTGDLAAGLGFLLAPPNGQIYFKTPTGRFCDGRLIVDFLSKVSISNLAKLCHFYCMQNDFVYTLQ